MKKMGFAGIILLLFYGCGDPPLIFPKEVKNEMIVNTAGATITMGEIFEGLKGEVVFIDVWATWCRDCLEGFPRVKELQKAYPNVTYLFLSVDRAQNAWKNGIRKYALKGEHYFLPQGQKGAFGDFLNSNWIPRYMILDRDGSIALFKAKNANDNDITLTLDKLIN